jgi:hypothetical protein
MKTGENQLNPSMAPARSIQAPPPFRPPFWHSTVRFAAALVLRGCCLLAFAAAADWPGWRGPSRNGISPETGLNWTWSASGPKPLWKAAVGKGFSSLAVAAGRVYTMGNTNNVDTVFCLDAATGQLIWKHSYACPLDPLAYEGGPSSTPATDDDRVYTLSKSGHLFCLDARSRGLSTPRQDQDPWWPLLVGAGNCRGAFICAQRAR